MRIITFSDLHGNAFALRAFLDQLHRTEYDRLIFCGDIFGYYYDQKEIIERLSRIPDLIWLRGNHDVYFSEVFKGLRDPEYCIIHYGHSYADVKTIEKEQIDYLDRLPSFCRIEDGKRTIGVFHGTPEDPVEGRLYPDTVIADPEAYAPYDIVILGHTHRQMFRRVPHSRGETLVWNTGSLGQPRDGRGFVYGELDTEKMKFVYHAVSPNLEELYRQIDEFDPDLEKLKEILERSPQ